MSPKVTSLLAIPVAVGLLAATATPASAYWNRGYGGYGGYGYHRGFGAGPAIAGAIVGLGVGAALSGAYAPRYYAPPPVYYAPPPVVYAPPPAYYGYPGYYR